MDGASVTATGGRALEWGKQARTTYAEIQLLAFAERG
jgi:hypothetical protein